MARKTITTTRTTKPPQPRGRSTRPPRGNCAKQTQFRLAQSSSKMNHIKGLGQHYSIGPSEKQTQFPLPPPPLRAALGRQPRPLSRPSSPSTIAATAGSLLTALLLMPVLGLWPAIPCPAGPVYPVGAYPALRRRQGARNAAVSGPFADSVVVGLDRSVEMPGHAAGRCTGPGRRARPHVRRFSPPGRPSAWG